MKVTNGAVHVLYAVVNDEGKAFGGFDPEVGAPSWVDDVYSAKLFSNKYDVKLRPNEKLVELEFELSPENTTVSDPFRPKRRKPTHP